MVVVSRGACACLVWFLEIESAHVHAAKGNLFVRNCQRLFSPAPTVPRRYGFSRAPRTWRASPAQRAKSTAEWRPCRGAIGTGGQFQSVAQTAVCATVARQLQGATAACAGGLEAPCPCWQARFVAVRQDLRWRSSQWRLASSSPPLPIPRSWANCRLRTHC